MKPNASPKCMQQKIIGKTIKCLKLFFILIMKENRNKSVK